MKNTKLNNQNGRSILETLGVLAIMGVLSVAGIQGYANAMNRYKANELLNETSMRAVSAAMEITAGKTPSKDMIKNFTNPQGYTFDLEKKNDKQFNIEISGVSNEVCEQMKKMLSDTVRDISECPEDKGLVVLSFNNDLTTNDFSDNENNENNEEADLLCVGITCDDCKKCSQGDCITAPEQEGYGCTTSNQEEGTCQAGTCVPPSPAIDVDVGVCENGNVYLSYMDYPCNIDTPMAGKNCDNDSQCLYGDSPSMSNTGCCDTNTHRCKAGILNGITTYACPIGSSRSCKKNSDCKNGEFCNITKEIIENTDYTQYAPNTGSCTPLDTGTPSTAAGNFATGQFLIGPSLTWWGAENWCKAHGRDVVSLSDLGITGGYEDGSCQQSYCIGADWTALRTALHLAQIRVKDSADFPWASTYKSTHSFFVSTSSYGESPYVSGGMPRERELPAVCR